MLGVEALGTAGAELLPTLLTVFGKDTLDAERYKKNSERAVKAIGADAVAPLREGLKHHAQAADAARLLGELKELAAPAVEDLPEIACDPGRISAASSNAPTALGQIGPAARPQLPKLLAAAANERLSAELRIGALGALGQVGTDDAVIKKGVADLQNTKDKAVAERATMALQLLNRP